MLACLDNCYTVLSRISVYYVADLGSSKLESVRFSVRETFIIILNKKDLGKSEWEEKVEEDEEEEIEYVLKER